MRVMCASFAALLLIAFPVRADTASNSSEHPASTATVVSMADAKANRLEAPRKRFQNAKSFYTYYGSGKVAELSHYDVAILHSPQMSAPDVKRLSNLGVVTIGYLTIGEDEQLQVGNGQGPAGKASWYFDQDHDGQADQNPIWKSWYTNANDPLWRATRVAAAKRLIEEYGFDGIFLDVLSVSELYPQSRPGMITMLRDLRAALPNAVIVMNQGFDIVADVAPLADGFMIESFTATYDFDTKKYALNDPASLDFHLKRARSVLNKAVRVNPLRVLVLDYAPPSDRETIQLAANRAASLGYMFSISPILLDDVYADVPKGEADEKWLQMHSSPERLSFRLPTARNGFPAGTVVMPSGNFAGYSVEPMFEAATDRSQFGWSKAAWASGEDGEPAWLEITLPTSQSGGELSIAWHDSAGPSRQFVVQVREDENSPWRDIDRRVDNIERVSKHALPKSGFQRLRIAQPPGGGSPGRSNLMWISRLELSH